MAFPRRLLTDGEELVLDLRPHWIALAGPVAAGVAIVAVWLVLARYLSHHFGELNQQRMMRGGPAAQAAPSVATELQRLADLRDRGVLTEEEFQAQKRKMLGGPAN